jgi:endonuclease/exonuclease/phosphatase family metal-dependent hydrolase
LKPPRSLRLLTWNIHGTFGLNPRFDLVRAIELIRKWQPDIIAFQEVDSRRDLPNGGDTFELLHNALGKQGVSAR